MNLHELRKKYPELLTYSRTKCFPKARVLGKSCRMPCIYVHYCRTSELKLRLLALGNRDYSREHLKRCLNAAYRLDGNGEAWTLIYLGIASTLPSGRTPAARFRHEFGLAGYLKQAPPLAALFLILRRSFPHWQTKCIARNRVYFSQAEHKGEFLDWCDCNVRCSWKELAAQMEGFSEKMEKKKVLESHERELFRHLKPLLNVKDNLNEFREWIRKARSDFYREVRTQC